MSNDRVSGVDPTLMITQSTVAPSPTAAVHVYVASTGSDTNAGTIASPKKTIAGAYALIPLLLAGPFVVHVASGTFAHSPPPPVLTLGPSAFVVVVGDGAGQSGDDGFTVVATGTTTTGNTLSKVVQAAGGMTVDAFAGYTLEITSGAAAGCRRLINSNTATELFLSNVLVDSTGAAVTAASGITYRIVRPAAVLDLAGMNPITNYHAADAHSCLVHYVQLAFTTTTTVPYLCHNNTRPQFLFGIELRAGTNFYGLGTQSIGTSATNVEFGRELARFIFAALSVSGSLSKWDGWGMSAPPGSVVGFDAGGRAYLAGYFVNIGLGQGGGEITLIMLGGRVPYLTHYRKGTIWLSGTTPIQIVTPVGQNAVGGFSHSAGPDVDISILGPVTMTQTGNVSPIFLHGNSRLDVMDTLTISAPDLTSNAAIVVSGNGALYAYSPITVSAGGGPALQVLGNGRVFASQLTGTQGALSTCSGNAHVSIAACSLNSSAGVLNIAENANVILGGNPSLVGTAPGAAAVQIVGGTLTVSGTVTITNNSTAANSDGLRCIGGGTFSCTLNPQITSAGSSGYGANLRGGGRFFSAVQPSGVVGASADFTVGASTSTDQYSDTMLAASFSSVSSGPSVAARST